MPFKAVYDATLGAFTLKQCTSAQLAPNNKVTAGRASGSVLPSAQFLESGEPKASWQTTDVAAALAAISATAGLNVTSTGIILPLRVLADGGTYVSGGANYRLIGASGLVIPTSLSCQGKSAAVLSLEAMFRSTDGHTAPVSKGGSITLTNPTFNKEYRLAPAIVGGVAVAGLTGGTVNFGLTTESNLEEDGYTWATQWFITEQNPTIDLTFRNQALADAFHDIVNDDLQFRLRRKAAGGTVDDATDAVHVTITAADGIRSVNQIGSSGSSQGEVTLQVSMTGLTVATTAALEEE